MNNGPDPVEGSMMAVGVLLFIGFLVLMSIVTN